MRSSSPLGVRSGAGVAGCEGPECVPSSILPYSLQCLTRSSSKRFLAYPITESSPIIMSSPLNGGAGLAGKSGRKTANACDTNAIEMSAETTAHFIFAARNTFTKVSNIVVR